MRIPLTSIKKAVIETEISLYSAPEKGTVKQRLTIAHRHGAIFHTAAVQAVGHTPIDVQDMEIDLLSASAHKFNGPKGVGFLYIRKGNPLISFNDGGAQEFGMRAGTENVAAIVGMSDVLRKNCVSLAENEKYILSLEEALLDRLNTSGLDYVRNGSENHIPGNISLSFKNTDGETLLHRLVNDYSK